MFYTLSRRAFALSLRHATALHCYQETETVYKAACGFGLTLISKRETMKLKLTCRYVECFMSVPETDRKMLIYKSHACMLSTVCGHKYCI